MSQQVTYRIGRGPRALSPDPERKDTLVDWVFDILPKVLFPAMGLVAIVLTIGVNQYTPH